MNITLPFDSTEHQQSPFSSSMRATKRDRSPFSFVEASHRERGRRFLHRRDPPKREVAVFLRRRDPPKREVTVSFVDEINRDVTVSLKIATERERNRRFVVERRATEGEKQMNERDDETRHLRSTQSHIATCPLRVVSSFS
ncbi:hypothetical protein DY000_02050502 [Brassica cretica]|uniref:Uncharacterized protein n=1 Tax=Brassica cretica TaxID=69181 RepID=A0ABQ7F4H5_BRACR|nr:hypothetical protein DY000_02050502 [Brassica cretica]